MEKKEERKEAKEEEGRNDDKERKAKPRFRIQWEEEEKKETKQGG